jgi:hypothetical protein
VPQPASAAATKTAAAVLVQRLLLFKIPYLDGKRNMRAQLARGQGRSVNNLTAVAGPAGG